MIAEGIRFLVYVLGLGVAALAIGVSALGILYDDTPRCERGSIVAMSGCHQGNEPMTRDPLATWHLEWLGKGTDDEKTFENPPASD